MQKYKIFERTLVTEGFLLGFIIYIRVAINPAGIICERYN